MIDGVCVQLYNPTDTAARSLAANLNASMIRYIRYDTIGEFNVDSKAECDRLNLAHETKTNKRQ